MNSVKLRSPYEIPLYVFSVLVNLIIIALILVGALLLGFLSRAREFSCDRHGAYLAPRGEEVF